MLVSKNDLFMINISQNHDFCLTLEESQDMMHIILRNGTNQKRWYEFRPMKIDGVDEGKCSFNTHSTGYKSYLRPKTMIIYDHTVSIGFPDEVETVRLKEPHVLHGKVKVLVWHKEPVGGKEDWDEFFDIECKILLGVGISWHSIIWTDWVAMERGGIDDEAANHELCMARYIMKRNK
jgi:hypothetical protein